jgi:hypothetical protein
MRRGHLAPVIGLALLVVAILGLTQLEQPSPILIFALCALYVVGNIVYAAWRHTLQLHTVSEFILVGLIAYVILTHFL